jgi:hypothetical protein
MSNKSDREQRGDITPAATLPNRDHPGVCAACDDWDGQIGVAGDGYWRYCHEHRSRWFVHDAADQGGRWDRLTARRRYDEAMRRHEAKRREFDPKTELEVLGIDRDISIEGYTVATPAFSSKQFPFGLGAACHGNCLECQETPLHHFFNAGIGLWWKDLEAGQLPEMWRCIRFDSEEERQAFHVLYDAADDRKHLLIFAAKPGLGREAALCEARESGPWAVEPSPADDGIPF